MNTLEARRRLLGRNVYKRTTEGNPAIAQGSLARRYPGITMQGWTEQAQYKGENLFDIASSGFPQQDKERVVFDNSDNKSAEYLWTKNVTAFGLQGGKTYTSRAVISTEEVRDGGDAAGSMWKTLYLQDNATYSANEKYAIVGSPNANGICYTTFTLPEDISALQYVVTRVNGYSRTIFSEIMIVEGDYNESNFPEYEPYTGRAPSPSPDYPQEIVSAGKYNEDMQKWEYEITIANEQTDPDKNQTVTLTADRPLTKWDNLEKRNGQWGWVYKSDVLEYDGDEGWIYYANNLRGEYSTLYCYDTRVLNKDYCYCDKFGHIVYPYDGEGIMDSYGSPNSFFISIKSNRLASTDADGFKQWLSENPLTVWYETAEETFAPLSESEQEQMNALYTFRPTTVLSNDCGCNMTLTYKTKKSLEVTD